MRPFIFHVEKKKNCHGSKENWSVYFAKICRKKYMQCSFVYEMFSSLVYNATLNSINIWVKMSVISIKVFYF